MVGRRRSSTLRLDDICIGTSWALGWDPRRLLLVDIIKSFASSCAMLAIRSLALLLM